MAGLSASPPKPLDPPESEVVADGWFPPVSLDLVRKGVRLGDGSVQTERLVAAIESAMVTAFRQLADWRTAHVLAGATELDQITARELNGENYAVKLWQRLILSLTAADLFAGNRDISATDKGLDRAADKEDGADEYYRRAWAAVADLKSLAPDGTETDVPRNRVELI
jgi:hypothetical protein